MGRRQRKLDKTLRHGIIYSIVGMLFSIASVFNFGPLYIVGGGLSVMSVVSGFKAKNTITISAGKLRGSTKAWWCIVAGGLGCMLAITFLTLSFGSYLDNSINPQ